MSVPQAAPGQLVDIGTVAAANIVKRLELATGKSEAEAAIVTNTVKRAIADEINAMSSHFTLAVADVQTQYEAEVLKIKSAFTYVKANKGVVAVWGAVVFLLGLAAGLAL
jgi:hypothetical protein